MAEACVNTLGPAQEVEAPMQAQNTQKTCTKCGETKPLEAFGGHKLTRDGRDTRCRVCTRARVAAWEKANREKKRAKSRRGYNSERARASYEKRMADPEHRAQARAREAERRKREPEKLRARQIAQRAVRDGRLTRPETCDECGGADSRIEGHHDDYTKPLEVRWLCVSCHRRTHSPYFGHAYQGEGKPDG